MALFTDGPPCSIEDLAAHDSQLLDVAGSEGIDVTKKLVLAHEHISIEIEVMLGRYLTAPPMSDIVVTPQLRLWHAYRTLHLVYADAYHNQLNDRYAAKRDQFEERARWACEQLKAIGIGTTPQPIARAQAPGVMQAPGVLANGLYFVGMTWINSIGEEGAASAPTSIAVSGSSFLVYPGEAATNAGGWNVYVGTDPETMYRQNDSPMATNESWLQPGALIAAGNKPGQGQSAAFVYPIQRILQRG